jgi:hypothetical protein
MNLYRLIIPFGVVTYAFFLLAVLSGAGRIKVGFIWHRRFALTGIALASIHAALVISTQVH